MADLRKDKETEGSAAEEAKGAVAEESKRDSTSAATDQPDQLDVSDLVARSADFFGVDSHITAGALHGRSRISLDDAKQRIKDWETKPQKKEA